MLSGRSGVTAIHGGPMRSTGNSCSPPTWKSRRARITAFAMWVVYSTSHPAG